MSLSSIEHDGNHGSPSAPPLHYIIPNEAGYFPAASCTGPLAVIENVTLYRSYPPTAEPVASAEPVAHGTLTLSDPDGGTADDVVLVGRCAETLFYILAEDAIVKISEFEFVLMLPHDGILLDLTHCDKEAVRRVESFLAARTKFHIESQTASNNLSGSYPDRLPDDSLSRALFGASQRASQLMLNAGELGASKINSYGEKKRDAIDPTTTKDVKIGDTSMRLAKVTRDMSEKTFSLTEKVSGKLSDFLGGKIGRAVAMKENDSDRKKKARSLLLASTIAYAEIGHGASEGYEKMVQSAQLQATSFIAKKYGQSAAELCRHTAGAAANFGRAALTARRIVDVKKVVKSAGKTMVKEGIKGSLQ